ncbi:uncharacterized protein LOC143019423 [Oratosquilla oratoria]|uniref:uncharacterized protein LOC143019423 n=1 Tax=Oratosquilla oratoria TaxID=337810 RepID=UPI003F75862C
MSDGLQLGNEPWKTCCSMKDRLSGCGVLRVKDLWWLTVVSASGDGRPSDVGAVEGMVLALADRLRLHTLIIIAEDSQTVNSCLRPPLCLSVASVLKHAAFCPLKVTHDPPHPPSRLRITALYSFESLMESAFCVLLCPSVFLICP